MPRGGAGSVLRTSCLLLYYVAKDSALGMFSNSLFYNGNIFDSIFTSFLPSFYEGVNVPYENSARHFSSVCREWIGLGMKRCVGEQE